MSDTTGNGGVSNVVHDDGDAAQTFQSAVLEATKARSDAPLRRWAFTGEGRARIRWGTPGDFTRCHTILSRHMSPKQAARICATWHHEATGEWPGRYSRNN